MMTTSIDSKSINNTHSSLLVSHFMHYGLVTCPSDTLIRNVIQRFNEQKIGSILVEDNQEIIGIWTRTDFVKLDITQPDILSQPIKMVMNSPVCRIHQDELISSATFLFHKMKIRHLLVVDQSGEGVGVLSELDLVNAKQSDSFLDGILLKELISGHLNWVMADAKLADVMSIMASKSVDALVVKDENAQGLISVRDLLKHFAEEGELGQLPVRELASWPLKSVSELQSLANVRRLMIENNIHHLGVEKASGELVGLISFSELLQHIEENFHYHASKSIKEKEQRILEAETLYRDLLTMSSDGILIHQNHKIAFANQEMMRMLGYDEKTLLSLTLEAIIPNKNRQEILACMDDNDHHHPSTSMHELLCQDGRLCQVQMTHKPITYHAEPAHLIVVSDLTFLAENERFQMLTRSVFDNAGEGIVVTDVENRFVLVNKKFEEITGYVFSEVVGKNPVLLSSGQHNRAFYETMWQTLKQDGVWQGEIWNRKKDGTVYPEWLTINEVRDKAGRLIHYVGLMNDLSQQKATEQEINRLSFYDILTGLPNVSLFKNRLQQAINKSRNETKQVALLIVDIARFKTINDAVGYEYGDQLLKNVSLRLNQMLDSEDSVARLGADNFLILLESIVHKNEVSEFAERLLTLFKAPFDIGRQHHVLDVKVGIAISSQDGDQALDLMKSADEALFEAKKAPHSQYAYHTSALTESTTEVFYFENALRKAVDQGQLVAYYQPQVALESGDIIGAEALVRWIHPDLGVVMPNKFIDIAESTGLIIPLGRTMLLQACQQWFKWHDQGLSLQRISVNVSTVQLTHPGFVETVAEVLQLTGLDAKVLELEVTESFLLQNEQAGIDMLHQLKELCVKLAMDDFGTGFSSLSYLKKLPLDQLKIDQSFISSLPDDKEDIAIVDAIIAVGNAVGVEVIAEGVENLTQVAYLLEKGCRLGQGYCYSRPIDAAAFFAWTENHLKPSLK